MFYRHFELGLELVSGFLNCHKCTVNDENAVGFLNVSSNNIWGNSVLFCGKIIYLIKKSHFLGFPIVKTRNQAKPQTLLEKFLVLIGILQESNALQPNKEKQTNQPQSATFCGINVN